MFFLRPIGEADISPYIGDHRPGGHDPAGMGSSACHI